MGQVVQKEWLNKYHLYNSKTFNVQKTLGINYSNILFIGDGTEV